MLRSKILVSKGNIDDDIKLLEKLVEEYKDNQIFKMKALLPLSNDYLVKGNLN